MSWLLFYIEALLAAAVLLVPGLLVAKSANVPTRFAISLGPILSVLILTLTGLFFHCLGLRLGFPLIAAPMVVISIVSLFLSFHFHGRFEEGFHLSDFAPMLFAVLVTFAVTAYVFRRGISSPDAFIQVYDNSFHLSVVQSMKASSDFSIMSVSSYLENGTASFNPDPAAGFYPAAWHILAALIAQAFELTTPIAINMTNFIFIAIIFPLGVQSLIRELFGNCPRTCLCASIVAVASTAFPWSFLYWGPVYPNLAAFCSVPAVAALMIWLFSKFDANLYFIRTDLGAWGLALLCMAALVVLQPNAVFTLGIILIPVLVSSLGGCIQTLVVNWKRLPLMAAKLIGRSLVLLLIALVWLLMYRASFMSAVVSFTWPSFTNLFDAIWRAASLSYNEGTPCFLLAVFVVLGCLRALANRRWTGYFGVYFFANLLFIVDATLDGPVRHVLTGFWYTDQYRVAAMASLFSIPLSTLGLDWTVDTITRALVEDGIDSAESSRVFPQILCGVLAACGLLWPQSVGFSFDNGYSPLGFTKGVTSYMYSLSDYDNNLTANEASFLTEVREIAGDDLIINNPFDGSVYGYAAYDLNIMYRKFSLVGDGETSTSRGLREGLDRYEDDLTVGNALKQTGAKYLLKLDYDESGREGVDMTRYRKSDWVGIDSVTDETPGFKLVLSRDDMRLYVIE